jgi:DNA mismatch repair protein MutS
VRCHSVAVREHKGQITFLHQVIAGAADRSYGVQVARLAGLPAAVLRRAEGVLHQLETQSRQQDNAVLPLFAAVSAQPQPPALSAQEEAWLAAGKSLAALSPDSLSARDALDWIYANHSVLPDINE